MLFAGLRSVPRVKNCESRLKIPRSQFFTIRTSQRANNTYIFSRQTEAIVYIFRGDTNLFLFIIWQGKSERSDWFFLGRDFAIRTVSVETVISCVFFVFESRQTQNKHGASAI